MLVKQVDEAAMQHTEELKAFHKVVYRMVFYLNGTAAWGFAAKKLYEVDAERYRKASMQDCISGLAEYIRQMANRQLVNVKARKAIIAAISKVERELLQDMPVDYPYLLGQYWQ